jgi:Recombinase
VGDSGINSGFPCAGARIPATLLLILKLPIPSATFLPPSRTSRSSHDAPMERQHAETSLRRRGVQGALANKQAADSRANALASTLRELRAAGFNSRRSLARELNRRGIPTAQGGRWHYTTVVRMLSRLGLLASYIDGRTNNGQAGKQSADAKAEALASTIRELQAKGLDTFAAIARELNARGISTPRGGKWYATSARRLLRRLKSWGYG